MNEELRRIREQGWKELRILVWVVVAAIVLLVTFSVVREYLEYKACVRLGMTSDECIYYMLTDF